jgi:hypothetical protein
VSLHIDVIENDWLAGQQRVVASLTFVDGVPTLSSLDLAKWGSVVGLAELPNPVRPEHEEGLLHQVSKRLHGDYLFATEPHEIEDCDYPQVAHLQSPQAAPHVHRARGRATAV